jgi:uncharacterized protein Yka (UPF0111/DUF47 family)
MGFTKKIAGMLKKKEPTRGPLPFDSVDSYILQKISEEEERITEDSHLFVEKIHTCVDQLSQFLEMLREKEREEMYKKLDMIVKSSQKRFADSLKNVVDRIHVEPEDYQQLKNSHEEVTDALQKMQKLNRMHGRYLYLAFDREMKTFTKTLREMATYNNLLGKLLRSEGEEIKNLREIHEKISEMEELQKEVANTRKEEISVQKDIKELETEIKKLQGQVNALKSSEEYQEVVSLEEQREELSETLKSIEQEIYNILHPLDRDFRKFRRQVDLGNISFDLKLLNRYEHFTEEFLKEKEGYPNLKKIAQEMKDALENQVIREKGRKKEKALDILELILNDGLLEYQREYYAVRRKLEKKSPDSDITEKIERIQKEIEENNRRMAKLEKRLESFSSRKEDIRSSIAEAEEEVRDRCDEVGIEIE